MQLLRQTFTFCTKGQRPFEYCGLQKKRGAALTSVRAIAGLSVPLRTWDSIDLPRLSRANGGAGGNSPKPSIPWTEGEIPGFHWPISSARFGWKLLYNGLRPALALAPE